MNYLWLSHEQVRAISRHALDEAPNEACGLIAGTDSRVSRIVPVENVAEQPATQFEMEPRALARHLPELAGEGLATLGFYHSHPTGDPIPSPSDISQSLWDDTVYLIVGLKRQKPQLGAWHIRQGRVTRIRIHVGDAPPPFDTETLSTAQKTAILVSAVIAAALMLIISLTLLPPAPPIP